MAKEGLPGINVALGSILSTAKENYICDSGDWLILSVPTGIGKKIDPSRMTLGGSLVQQCKDGGNNSRI